MEILVFVGLLVLGFVASISFGIASTIGAVVSGDPLSRSKNRVIFGSFIAGLGQTYCFLAYIGYFVDWILNSTEGESTYRIIYLTIAFLVIQIQMGISLARSKDRAKVKPEMDYEAIIGGHPFTIIFCIIGFFLFVFNEGIWKELYWWWF